MTMRALVILAAVCISADRIRSKPTAQIGNKPLAPARPQTRANSLERSRGQNFGPETVRTPLNLEVPHLPSKPTRRRYLSKRRAQFLPARNNNNIAIRRLVAIGLKAKGKA